MNILTEADVLRYVTFECMGSSEDHLVDIRMDLRALMSKVGMLLVNGGAAGWGAERRLGSIRVSAGAKGLIEFTVPPRVTDGGVFPVSFDRVRSVLSTIETNVQGFMVCRFSVAARMLLQYLMNIRVSIPVGCGVGVWEISDDDRRALREVRNAVRDRLSMSLRSPRAIPVPSAGGMGMSVFIVDARGYNRAERPEDALRLMVPEPSPSVSTASTVSTAYGSLGDTIAYASLAPFTPEELLASDLAVSSASAGEISARGTAASADEFSVSDSAASPAAQATAGEEPAGSGVRLSDDSTITVDESLFGNTFATSMASGWRGYDREAVRVVLTRGGPSRGASDHGGMSDSVVFDKEVFEDVVDAAVKYLPSVRYLPPVPKPREIRP